MWLRRTLLLSLAQVAGIAWDASPDASVTAYAVTVDAAPLTTTSAVFVPWTPTAAGHRVCVASIAGSVTGAPACINYGTPAQPPPQPPPVALPVVTPTTCKISVANKPDARTGWGVQFTRDGVNVGGRDTSAPYERTTTYLAGTHVWQAIWTKSGEPSITILVTTMGCQ